MVEVLPEIKEKLEKITQIQSISYDTVEKQFFEIYNDDFIQKDTHFKNDKEKQEYALAILYGKIFTAPPAQKYSVVPIGYGGLRTTKSGVFQSTIFAFVKGIDGLCRIVCRGAVADLYKNVALFTKYDDVYLSKFEGSNDFLADERTRFEDGNFIGGEEILKNLNYTRTEIKEIYDKHLESRKVGGYVDETDWFYVEGIVRRVHKGVRPDGTEYVVYTVHDKDVDKMITPDGNVLTLSVWTIPEFQFPENVYCKFLGSVTWRNRDGVEKPMMNGFLIEPIITGGD